MNFVILHGLEATSRSHWLPWLKAELEEDGHRAWVPDLPNSDRPDEKVWTHFIFDSCPFGFDEDLVLIGWSAGAVEAMHLLPKFDHQIHGTILLSAFINNLGWDELSDMFQQDFNFEGIQQNGGKIIFMHGSDDPHCPLQDAHYLADQTSASFRIIDGAGHFSTDGNPRFSELPEILPIIEEILNG